MKNQKQNEPDRQLNLLNQAARYESERARNALLQSQLEALRKHIRVLEDRPLHGQTANELQWMKWELGHLQDLTDQEQKKLGGLKGIFRKLREALRTQGRHS